MYAYDARREETFGRQTSEMLDLIGTNYYEIWGGIDGYAVSAPHHKLYDSFDGDESALKREVGMSLEKLQDLVTLRAGTAYALTKDIYEERTGEKFPQDAVDRTGKNSAVVMVLSLADVKERARTGKFAS